MKIKVALVVVVSMLFGGIVSYASLHGTFEGNPIVKIVSNGQALTVEDVPAINYNGRTMVPIYMLRQLGMDVNWDASQETVNISTTGIASTLPASSDSETIIRLKLQMRIAYTYEQLEDLGSLLLHNYNAIDSAFSSIYEGYGNASERLQNVQKVMNTAIDHYNEQLKINEVLLSEASYYGYNLNDFNSIMNKYYSAIDYYKLSQNGLYDFQASDSQVNFDKIFNNLKSAADEISSARNIAFDGYLYFYSLTQK